jgi:hypothetical protein
MAAFAPRTVIELLADDAIEMLETEAAHSTSGNNVEADAADSNETVVFPAVVGSRSWTFAGVDCPCRK